VILVLVKINNTIFGNFKFGRAAWEARYWLLIGVLTVQFVPHRKHTPSP
jgi:hypothetical protein